MVTGIEKVWFAIQLSLLLYCFTVRTTAKSLYPHLQCRDPTFGNGYDQQADRKFLILSGRGVGGIGNYLLFYPAAYYFAALTGRVSSSLHPTIPYFISQVPINHLVQNI